jgi:phosphoribosylanthranilate isomerase
MIKIKICGITNIEDALSALNLGADAIGFVFAKSKRQIDASLCAGILKELSPFCYTVGVFRNNSADFINSVLDICPLSALQFHGDEDNDFCISFKRHVIKAVTIDKEEDLNKIAAYPGIKDILLDGKNPGEGELFDHTYIKNLPGSKNIILAGGLNPENVAEVVKNNRRLSAVDVSSGVEAYYGKKDYNKVKNFIERARTALK